MDVQNTGKFVIRSAEFIKSAMSLSGCPPEEFPEVAFAGRSNVGKSSLMNCLLQRRKLVRTSNTPGRTQALNFFLINGAYYLVDLPGYGYARVPEKIRASWGPMMEQYLTGRQSLRGLVLVLDARHTPTLDDVGLFKWLSQQGLEVILVLTKIDKLKRGEWNSRVVDSAARLGVAREDLLLFSAETRHGREELVARLTTLLGPEPTMDSEDPVNR